MSDARRIALLGRFPDDLCVRVVDVGVDYTMDQVARACAELTLDRTVRDPGPGARLFVRRTTPDDSAVPFPPEVTVADAGFRHFECVDVLVV